MSDVACFVNGRLRENCYVVARDADAVIVDPGGAVDEIADHVARYGLNVRAVLATHAHPDHIAAAATVVKAYRAPFHLHPADERLLARASFYRKVLHGEDSIEVPDLDVSLEDVARLRFGALEVEVIHTPGHTPGGVCFRVGGDLFTGDTLGSDHIGRTDLPGGDREALDRSIAELAARWPRDAAIRPGHGGAARAGDVLGNGAALTELRG
jgi:hydroxyacylglutathione hydrolase